jgi:hypothetical protein
VGLAHSPHTSRAPPTSRASPPPSSHPSHPPLVPLLARRYLHENSLSGSLPTQLGALTALTRMCARRARAPPCPRRRGEAGARERGGESTWGWHTAPTPPMPPPHLPRLSTPFLSPLSPLACGAPSRSQVPSRQQPERQPAHAARRPHRADAPVSPPRSAARPARGGVGRQGRGSEGARARGAGTQPPHLPWPLHLPRLSTPFLSPLSPPTGARSRSQVPSRQQSERQPAHAARRPHQAGVPVSPPRSAAALPAAAWGGRGEGARGREHMGLAHSPHTSHAPPTSRASPPPSSHPSHPSLWCPFSLAGTFTRTA